MSLICLSPNGVDLYRLEGPPGALLVGTMDGVVELRARSGGIWDVAQRRLEGVHVGALASDLARGGLFAGSHTHGMFRSLDGGDVWSGISDGFASQNIFTLALDPATTPATIYAGTEPAFLYRSTDYGASWVELTGLREAPTRAAWNFPAPPHIAHVKHVTVDPRDSAILYVCIEQGALLRSNDGGKTFVELDFQDETYHLNKDAHRIVFHPDNPDQIYLDGGEGLTLSLDGGASWRRVTDHNARVGYPDQLFISPEADRTIYIAGGGVPPNIWRQTGDARATLMRSRDQGVSWEQFGAGLPASLPGNIEAVTMATWPGGFGFFAGTTDGEVYGSLDHGENWTLIADGIAPVSKCIHHRNLTMGRAAVAAAQAS